MKLSFNSFMHKNTKKMLTLAVSIVLLVIVVSYIVFFIYMNGTYKSFIVNYVLSCQETDMKEISKIEQEMPKIASSVIDDQGIYNVLSGKSNGNVAELTKAEQFLKTFKSKNGIKSLMIYDYKKNELYTNMITKRYIAKPEEDTTVFGTIYKEYKNGKNYISVSDSWSDSVWYLYSDFRGYYVIIEIDKISMSAKTVNVKRFIDYDNWIYYKDSLFITNSNVADPMQDEKLADIANDYTVTSYERGGNLYIFKRSGNFLYIGAVDSTEFLSAGFKSAKVIWVLAVAFLLVTLVLYLFYNKKYYIIENKYTTAVKMHEKSIQRATIEKVLFNAFVNTKLSEKDKALVKERFKGYSDFRIIVIDIDNVKENFDEDDVSIYKYGIINICSEIFSVFGIVETVLMHEGYIGVVIGVKNPVSTAEIKQCVAMFMEITKGYIESTVTCAVSNNKKSCDEMLKKCFATVGLVSYRYLFGNGSLLMEDDIVATRTAIDYPDDLQNSILQAISDNDENKYLQCIDELKSKMKLLVYDVAQEWCLELLHSVLGSKSLKRKSTANIVKLYNCNTVDEFADGLRSVIFDSYDDEPRHDSEFKSKVEMLIDENYSDPDFCMDTVASKLGISNVYVGRKFKYEFSTTFNGYLANYRIEKSLEMLKNTDEKIFEISVACGFRSATYFSTMFKKLMRMSPNEYRERYGNEADK